MKSFVYAIYDRIAEEGGPVWAAKSDAVAVRNCRIHLKETNADEYRLYCLGSYDSEAVCLTGTEKREVPIVDAVKLPPGTGVEAVSMAALRASRKEK